MHPSKVRRNSTHAPRFSLVIPTYRRPRALRDCLLGIAELDCDQIPFEVFVVDDGSGIDLKGVVKEFQSSLNLKLLSQPRNLGPAAARNRGAAEASGHFLAFIDDDCVPGVNWLRALNGHFDTDSNRAIGGNCLNALGDNLWSVAQQMLLDYLNRYYNSDPDRARFCPSNNLTVPREHFFKIGGFDTSFRFAAGEDRNFSERWIRSEARMSFATDVTVHHRHAMSLKSFFRLHQGYGRGACRFRRKTASTGGHASFEPPGFYIGLIFFPYSQTAFGRATLITLAQVFSQLAHTVGYVQERLRSG